MTQPTHSPLGASGAERWMACSGSVALIKALDLPPSDESSFAKEGTAAHEAAAWCLHNKADSWEIVGQFFYEVEATAEMANAVQVYLDTVRPLMVENTTVLIEHRISSPDHQDFYGTVDCATVADSLLTVTDFKYGAGIAVDVEHNPQLMYYAYGVLVSHPDVRRVVLRIVQPRAFHPDGLVRRWEMTAEEICTWANDELIPAMLRTEMDHDLNPGPWCRFCPAKLVCPVMEALFGAAMTADPKEIINWSPAKLGRQYQYMQAVKMYVKALESEAYRVLMTGEAVPGTKLVNKKANRVYKPEAPAIFTARFGNEAYTKPEMKSPAAMEELGSEAKMLVKRWAYTPQSGYTVALESDKRLGVKPQTTTEAFGATVAAMEGEQS